MKRGFLGADTIDFECYADADFPDNDFQLTDADGLPVSGVGFTPIWTVRSFDDAAGLPLISQAVTWVNQSAGQFRIVVAGSAFAALPRTSTATNEPTVFRHQLQDTAGDDRMFFGNLFVYGVI